MKNIDQNKTKKETEDQKSLEQFQVKLERLEMKLAQIGPSTSSY